MFTRHLTAWCPGRLLAFSGVDGQTDNENGLILRTSPGRSGLDVKLPGEGKIRFAIPAGQDVLLTGDCFSTGTLKGAFVDAHHFLLEGPCAVELDAKLDVLAADNRTLVAPKGFLNPAHLTLDLDELIAARLAWLGRHAANASRPVCLALSQLKTQLCSPEGAIKHRWTTPDRWPHRNMWLWDSAFHAIGLRHVDLPLAREALEAVLDVQRADGFIPHMAAPTRSSEITQPPVLAFAAALVDELQPSNAWIASLYPKLKAYLQWDMDNRDTDGAGLLEWFIEGDPLCRSGESGADNSSRFDCASSLDAPDFNAFIAQEFEAMAAFARRLGLKEDVQQWQALLARTNTLMNQRLWNEELGLYMDFDNATKRQTDVMSFAAFLPLICGAPSAAQAAKLAAHLSNPDTFGTPLPLPTIPPSQTQYYSKDMWRGPVWVNINWLVARGLRRYGHVAEAKRLIDLTAAEIEDMAEKHGTFFEFYDAERQLDPPQLPRKGANDPANPYHQPLFDYGWTATLYLDMVMSQ